MNIKFLKDYAGRETAMKEYKAGTTAEFPTAQALELVRMGVAKEPWAEIGKAYDPKPIAPPAPAVVEEKKVTAPPVPAKRKRKKLP